MRKRYRKLQLVVKQREMGLSQTLTDSDILCSLTKNTFSVIYTQTHTQTTAQSQDYTHTCVCHYTRNHLFCYRQRNNKCE